MGYNSAPGSVFFDREAEMVRNGPAFVGGIAVRRLCCCTFALVHYLPSTKPTGRRNHRRRHRVDGNNCLFSTHWHGSTSKFIWIQAGFILWIDFNRAYWKWTTTDLLCWLQLGISKGPDVGQVCTC